MNRTPYISLFCMLLTGFSLSAQHDTTVLAPHTVTGRNVYDISGYHTTTVDSLHMHYAVGETLGELLQTVTPSAVRDYGTGQLSTVGIRGGAAEHTQITWNGFRINQAMNGQTDLSLLSAGLFNAIHLETGAGSLIHGSGAFGGLLALSSRIDTSQLPYYSGSYERGSFSKEVSRILLFNTAKRFFLKTTLFQDKALNDYEYYSRLLATPSCEKRANAYYATGGVMQQAVYQTGKRSAIEVLLWHQETDKGIPRPVHLPQDDGQSQSDKMMKLFVNGNHYSNKNRFAWRAGYQNNRMRFLDERYRIDAKHNAQNIQTALSLDGQKGALDFRLGIDYEYQFVRSSEYQGEKERHVLSLYATGNIKLHERFYMFAVARNEISEAYGCHFLPSIGAGFFIDKHKQHILRLSGIKNHKVPTLNDIYWEPGGNSALIPENGLSGELDYKGTVLLKKRTKATMQTAAYYQDISQRITWMPDGTGI
ncbi:MAG: TonB-dependent receptor plug domain-containing protein, partial [Bacteroidales bacterium]|nr:TonB-dependent receptor plug domain-containing protein [Bacteroidales bacterium]